MNFTTLDLNLLKVFIAIQHEGTITAAGLKLGMTQPSTSNALKRLRHQLGDPLFVRTPGGMEPTPFALGIAPAIAHALNALQHALENDRVFEAATSTRAFRVLLTDAGESIFLPRLMERLRQVAPGLRIIAQPLPRERYREALESGVADLALGQLPPGQSQLIQQRLFDDRLVCLVGPQHPIRTPRMTPRQFLDAPQIMITQPAQVEVHVRRALGRRANHRRIALEVPHYMAAPAVVARTDLMAVVPHTVSAALPADLGLRTLPLPFRVAPLSVRQFWHERAQNDPGHRWLRALVNDIFGQPRPRGGAAPVPP